MSNQESAGRILAMVGIGLTLAAGGLVLATNFRGLTDKHVNLSVRWSVPAARRSEKRRRRLVLLDRFVGVVIALFGLGTLGAGITFLIGKFR